MRGHMQTAGTGVKLTRSCTQAAGTRMKPARSCMQATGTGMKLANWGINCMQTANQGGIGKETYENGELGWNWQELYANSRNQDKTGKLEWNQQWTIWKWWTRGHLARTAYENDENGDDRGDENGCETSSEGRQVAKRVCVQFSSLGKVKRVLVKVQRRWGWKNSWHPKKFSCSKKGLEKEMTVRCHVE